MARRVVAGATGLIGKRLVELWLEQNHDVTVIGRSLARIEKAFGKDRVRAVMWDNLTVKDVADAEVVVNLTGESVGKKKWTNAQKKEIINSRVGSTKKISLLLATLGEKSPVLFNASAIGIYGLQSHLKQGLPPQLDETSTIEFDNPGDFLSLVGTKWEKAADPAVAAGVRVVFLRFGVVLAKNEGALPKLMKPFKFYIGGPIGSGEQPFSWVGIDDVIRAIDFLVSKGDAIGAYNIVAPGVVKEAILAQMIGKELNRPDLVRMPGFLLKLMVGQEMAQELLLEGQNVYSKRLIDAGFKFSYPDLETALNRIFLVKSVRMKFFRK